MKTKTHSEKNRPKQHGPTAYREKCQAENSQRNPIKPIQQNVEFVLHKIGCITLHYLRVPLLRRPRQNPSHMRPPFPVTRSVGISLFFGKRMVNSMSNDPINLSTFKSECTANRQKIFNRLWDFVAAMCKQTVKPHPYSQASRNDP